MAKDRDHDRLSSALDVSSALSADRRDQRNPGISAADDDPNLREERLLRSMFHNVSRIPHGHAQMMAAIAAGKPESQTTAQTGKERQRKEENARYLSLEMQRLAEWNAKIVTIAGVQMTNEEAQRARRRFIENEDEYAERAVQRGLIRDGEQGTLKHSVRRRCDLEERVGRGDATAAERKELHDLKNSRMGRATDEITAAIHKNGFENSAKTSIAKDPGASPADTELPTAREIFQSTPVAQKAFIQAAQPIVPSNDTPQEILPETPTITHSVKPTGLEI